MPHKHYTESEYRAVLQDQWRKDNEYLREQGIIPPWINNDLTLEKDEAKILTLVRDSYGFITGAAIPVDLFGERVVSDKPDLSDLSKAIGFSSEGNALASLDKCLTKGYVRRDVDPESGREIILLTLDGRDALDDWEEDMENGGMDE